MGRQELEEPESSQNYYVVNGSSFQHDYPIGFLPANVESGPLIKIVFITEIDNKVLVCVPFSPWHRQVSRRVLKATLTKPSAVEVLAVPEESREEPQEEAKCMKLWVGLITHELVGHVHWDEDPGAAECAFTLDGVQGFVPFAKSLADAASEHFAFLSAESMEASGLDLKSWTLAWTGWSW